MTQEQKDADPKAEENNQNSHQAHLKEGLAKLKVCCVGHAVSCELQLRLYCGLKLAACHPAASSTVSCLKKV